MKTFITAIVVTLLLLFGICGYIVYLNSAADTFLSLTNSVTECAEQNEWETCQKKAEQLEKMWKEKKDMLCAFTDHGDLDKMEQTIYEVKESVRYRDEEETVRYAAVLVSIIERLRDNESITWENILKGGTADMPVA